MRIRGGLIISDVTVDGTPISTLSPCSEKKVFLKCDVCGKEYLAFYGNYYLAQVKRNFSGSTYCKPCATRRAIKTRKIVSLKGIPRPNIRGPNSSCWVGVRE